MSGHAATSDHPRRPDGAGLTQLAALFAVLLSMSSLLAVAFKLNGNSAQPASAANSVTMNGSGMHGAIGGFSGAAAPAETIKLVIKSDEEEGKKGPEGTWHDAFLPADFSVQPGATVQVTVYNYDDMPHTFTSMALGTNVEIPGGSEDKPSKATFTFRAPQKAGSYEWHCILPCDPWSMAHFGFMKGHVTVA